MPLRYRITTLGCRVNHAETREIETILRSRGLEPAAAREPAELEVVHTCSVTHSAAAKSRQAIRRAARRQADAERERPAVFVTGCFATTDTKAAIALAGDADRVVRHEGGPAGADPGLERLADGIDRWLERQPRRPGTGRASREAEIIPLPVVMPHAPAEHVRAELKIQDGCDAHCTFCIIPKIRRTLRSKSVREAVAETRRLVELGHREVVLTGIFIGAYGHETALRRRQRRRHAEPLADLVDAIAQVPGLQRLRISSMEPGDVTAALVDAMVANEPVVVPHLHLPLQSGSDRVLRRMNRQYRVGDYLDMIDMVDEALRRPATGDGLPPAITTDVICGFPGETGDDFDRTVAVARRVGYLHMHVFPYSPRRGTAAARWRDERVPSVEIRRRVQRLIALESDPHDGLSIRYRRRLIGRRVRVIVEREAGDEPGVVTGRCDHYALVHLRSNRRRGTLLDVRITDASGIRTWGEVELPSLRLPVVTDRP